MIDRGPENPSILSSHMSASGIRYETDVTLRDLFALQIAAALATYRDGHVGYSPRELAETAYEHADALLAERAK